MRVVVPDPALSVRRGREDASSGAKDAAGFTHDRDRVSNVFEDVFEDDGIEGGVVEGERLVDIRTQHVSPLRGWAASVASGMRIDPRVVRKVLGQPSVSAADVENLGVDAGKWRVTSL